MHGNTNILFFKGMQRINIYTILLTWPPSGHDREVIPPECKVTLSVVDVHIHPVSADVKVAEIVGAERVPRYVTYPFWGRHSVE